MTSGRQHVGKLGEREACSRLADAGYDIRQTNWRCRLGEIDIIAEQDGRMVFVEVRTRRIGGKYGTAAESVDHRKRMKIRAVAAMYLQAFKLADSAIRFDVIAITLDSNDCVLEYKHYEAAF